MARSTESILEEILNSLQAGGGGGGMRQSTAEQIAEAIRLAGTQRRERRSNTSTAEELIKASGALASSFERAKNAGEGVSSLATGFKSIGSTILPGFSFAINLATDAAEKLYTFMNDASEAYKSFNTQGMQTSGGMLDLYGALAGGRLNLEEFMNATASTRDVIASMGSEGTRDFGKMLNTVIEGQVAMSRLNMTNEQMATYLAGNLKRQKAYGTFEQLSNMEQDASNRQYMDNLNSYSKALGISTDALNKKMNDASDSVVGFGTALSLEQDYGLDKETAAKTADNFALGLASMGDFGTFMQDEAARALAMGTFDIDSDFGKLYQANDDVKAGFHKLLSEMQSGNLAGEDAADRIRKIFANTDMVESIENSMRTMRGSFTDAEASQIIAMNNQLRNAATAQAQAQHKVDQFWDKFISDINISVEGMYTGFRTNIAEAFMDPTAWNLKTFGDDFGGFLNMSLDEVMANVGTYMKRVGPAMEEEFKVLKVWLAARGDAISAHFPTYNEIIDAILPDWLRDLVLAEKNNSIKTGQEFIDTMQDATTTWFDSIFNSVDEATKNFNDTKEQRAKQHIEEQLKAGSGILGRVQTTINNNTTNNQNTLAAQRTIAIQQPVTRSHEEQNSAMNNARLQYEKERMELQKKLLQEQVRANDIATSNLQATRKVAKQQEGNQVN